MAAVVIRVRHHLCHAEIHLWSSPFLIISKIGPSCRTSITGLRAFSKALLNPDEQILCIEAEEENLLRIENTKESHLKRKPLSSGP